MFQPEHVTYRSGILNCAADLYLPEAADGPVAAVVCGESGAKVKEMTAAPARYLVDADFAVLAIGYLYRSKVIAARQAVSPCSLMRA